MMTKKQRKMGPSLKPGCPPSREGTDALHLEPAGRVGTQPFMLQVRKLPLQVRLKGGRGTGPPGWWVKVIVSVVSDSATPWTVTHQAPPSMGFSRQEYWSGVPLPSPVHGLPPSYFCLGSISMKWPHLNGRALPSQLPFPCYFSFNFYIAFIIYSVLCLFYLLSFSL